MKVGFVFTKKEGHKQEESHQGNSLEALAVDQPFAQDYLLKEELDLLWQDTC